MSTLDSILIIQVCLIDLFMPFTTAEIVDGFNSEKYFCFLEWMILFTCYFPCYFWYCVCECLHSKWYWCVIKSFLVSDVKVVSSLTIFVIILMFHTHCQQQNNINTICDRHGGENIWTVSWAVSRVKVLISSCHNLNCCI